MKRVHEFHNNPEADWISKAIQLGMVTRDGVDNWDRYGKRMPNFVTEMAIDDKT